jgi:hypothetical protein
MVFIAAANVSVAPVKPSIARPNHSSAATKLSIATAKVVLARAQASVAAAKVFVAHVEPSAAQSYHSSAAAQVFALLPNFPVLPATKENARIAAAGQPCIRATLVLLVRN